MNVHRYISQWGVWYLQRKSTPKNEVLQLKTLIFWRLSEDFESEEIGVSVKTWYSCEEYEAWRLPFSWFCFSLSWVIGNTILLKGVEEILRKNFYVMLNSKSYTYQSLRVKPLEISYSSVIFFSDRDGVLLYLAIKFLNISIYTSYVYPRSKLNLYCHQSPKRGRL